MAHATKKDTIMAKATLADFQVESLGVEWPDYFQGYGCAFSGFRYCAYGIGDTEEALADCLEMMAQSAGFDLDERAEQRIREAYGPCDTTTVADELGLTEKEREEIDESGEGCYFHVGIKWNESN